MTTYTVKRIFMNSNRKVTIYRNLTLQEAQDHCRDPETSSSKCTSSAGKARTKKYGPWFDSYDRD